MPKIEPFGGKFRDPASMLHRIAEDSELIESFFIMIKMKNGDVVPAHFQFTLEQMAFTGAYCLREAVDPGNETLKRPT